MFKMSLPRLILLAVLATLLSAGCAKKPAPAPEEEAPAVTEMSEQEVSGIQEDGLRESVVGEEAAGMAGEAEAALPELQRVFFDFDQYVLTPEARATLADNAAYLKATGAKVRIEGHCDERGSDEYNLALGERRAQAAEKYLISLGVDPGQLEIISYGEEKPLVRGSGEEAWAKNRRAEFVVAR